MTTQNTQKITICYTLTSSEQDNYAEMLAVSAKSVRRIHPDAIIYLLVDDKTDSYLRQNRRQLIDYFDHYRSVETPYSGGPASRYVKTKQRELVEGDYLFIDVDTLLLRPLDSLFQQKPFFGAVPEVSPYDWKDPINDEWVQEVFTKCDWIPRTSPYFNSGVLFWEDSEAARTLCSEWHRLWLEAYNCTGKYIDQPSLHYALNRWESTATTLSNQYNFILFFPLNFKVVGIRKQVAARRELIRNAIIWHFAGGIENTVLGALMDKHKQTGEVDWEFLDQSVRQGLPWAQDGRNLERHILRGSYLSMLSLWIHFWVRNRLKGY